MKIHDRNYDIILCYLVTSHLKKKEVEGNIFEINSKITTKDKMKLFFPNKLHMRFIHTIRNLVKFVVFDGIL